MRTIVYAMAFAAAGLLAGCANEGEVGEVDLGYLRVVKSNVSFEYGGGEGTIEVDTNEAVTVAEDADWVTTSVTGNVVKVTAGVNTTIMSRNAMVTVKAGERSVVVPVSQEAEMLRTADEWLFNSADDGSKWADARTFNFHPAGGNGAVKMVETADWFAVTIDHAAGTATVVAQPNESLDERKADIEVSLGDQKRTVSVVQTGTRFFFEGEAKLSYLRAGGEKSLDIFIPGAQIVTITSTTTWVSGSYADGKLTVTTNVNAGDARSASLTLTASSGATMDVAIEQAGHPLVGTFAAVAESVYGVNPSYPDNGFNGDVTIANTGENLFTISGLENAATTIKMLYDEEAKTLSCANGYYVGEYDSGYGPYYMSIYLYNNNGGSFAEDADTTKKIVFKVNVTDEKVEITYDAPENTYGFGYTYYSWRDYDPIDAYKKLVMTRK